MHSTKYTAALAVAACLLPLAACGGGGGGGGPVSGMPDMPSEPPTPETVHTADQDKLIAAGIAASTARPAFGSVTQSSNKDAAGVSTDSAQSSFDGDTYTLRIARRNGSTLSLNTDDHEVDGDTVTSTVTGREMSAGLLLDYDARSITLAGGAVEFDPGYGGWMSRGYWFHLTGNWADGDVSRVEVGAFVDGPEFSGPASVPVGGTATYEGVAAGIASTKGQTTGPFQRETLSYAGDFRLTADFSSGLVSGEIHSESVVGFRTLDDGNPSPGGRPDDARIALGPTSINSDGSFVGSDVTLMSSTVNTQGSSSEGYWGGQFSTIDDSTGNPRAVAGTHGVTYTTPAGYTVTYVGYHFGATDDF